MGAKAFPSTHRIKVFADGTVRKSHSVTPGDLVRSSAGTEVSRPISQTVKWKVTSCEESDDRIVPDAR